MTGNHTGSMTANPGNFTGTSDPTPDRHREARARSVHDLLTADFGTCDHRRETMQMWQCRRWADALASPAGPEEPREGLREAVAAVRLDASDSGLHGLALDKTGAFNRGVDALAARLATTTPDTGAEERLRVALLDAIAFGHNVAYPKLGHTGDDWSRCQQPLCVRVRVLSGGSVDEERDSDES